MNAQIRARKKGAERFLKGFFKIFVVLALVFQPVAINGSFGIPRLAIAEDGVEAPSNENANEDDSASEEAEQETDEAEEQETEDPVEEINTPEEPAVTEEAVVTETPTEEINESDDSVETEDSEEDTTEEEGAEAPADKQEKTPETVCLGANDEVKDSSASDWEIKEDGKIAETKEKVKLGVKYQFPGNDDVSVTFTCLPSDESKLDTLKIEEVDVSDLNFPDGIVAASEHAYDITTGMDNGDFKYDVVLPKTAGVDATLSYIEKSIAEAKDGDLSKSDLKEVKKSDVSDKGDTIEGEGLDHFTIFIATYTSNTFVTVDTLYLQGETVYVNSTGLTQANGTYYRINLVEPDGITTRTIGACQQNIASKNGSYILPFNAPLGAWTAVIKRHDNSGECNNGTDVKDTGVANFAVTAGNSPDLTVNKTNNVGGTVGFGNSFTWTVTVTNVGNTAAIFNNENILLDEFPTGVTTNATNLSVSTSGGVTGTVDCDLTNGLLDCDDDNTAGTVTIPAGGSFSVGVVVTPASPGTITNPRSNGSCEADPNDVEAESNEGNNLCSDTVTVASPFDLTVTKTNNVAGAGLLNTPYTWTLTVTNAGTAAMTFNNQNILVDNLPSVGAIYAVGAVTTGGGVTGTVDCTIGSNNLDCDDNSGGTTVVIPAGGSFSVPITVTPTAVGSLVNPRTANSGQCAADPDDLFVESNENNNACADTVTIASPYDLTVTKTNDVNGSVITNTPFIWTLEVENTGTAAVTFNNQDILEDDLPSSGATYALGSVTTQGGITGTISCGISSNTLLCEDTNSAGVVTIPAGASFMVPITVTPTEDGALVNPRTANNGQCSVDPDSVLTESNENNNDCSDTVNVSAYQVTQNPSLSQACGLDIALVIDNSTSISTSELNQMKAAMTGFTGALNGTPTEFSVTRFATTASVSQAFTANISTVDSAINGIPVGAGFTNWQDGLTKTQSTLPNRANPNLVIFASDGNPNRTGNPESTVTETQATADAVIVANAIKASGTRVIALGIGNELDVDNLKAISGSTVGNDLNADVITADFDTLASTLATFASETCGGTITLKKEITGENNPTLSGWQFTVDGNNYSTDANGFTQAIPVTPGTYTAVETQKAGYSLASAVCTKNNQPVGSPMQNGVGALTVGANDIIACTFTNSKNTATITVNKIVSPIDDTGKFNLQIDGATAGTGANVGNGGTTGAISVDPALQHTISETAGTDTTLNDYATTWSCNNNASGTGTTIPVSLTTGQNLVCTFTNTLTFTPTKICHATGSQNNPYIINTPNNSGQLMGHVGIGHQNGEDIIPPIPGLLPDGQNWDAAGQAIWRNDCKATGGLKAVKAVDDQTSLTQWSFALDNGNPVQADANGEVDFGQVALGDHTVTESGPNGYSLSSVVGCTQVPQTLSATANVTAGATTVCTFSNAVNRGSITIIKDAQPDDAQDFTFTASGNGVGGFTLDDDGNSQNGTSNTQSFQSLFPGQYSFTEGGVTGWDLDSISCNNGNASVGSQNGNTVTLNLQAGENITCTFTNVRNTGTITIVKDAINNNPQNFSFSTNFDVSPNQGTQTTFQLDDDNNGALPNTRTFTLPAGNYTVQEGTDLTWKLTGLACNDQNGSVNINNRTATLNLESDEAITCTFTNTQLGYVKGLKFNDLNADGQWNLFQGEFGLGNWRIFVDGDNNQTYDLGEMTTMTSNFFLTRGAYLFTGGLLPGTYNICEEMQTGWTNATPLCQSVEITPGDLEAVNFGNYQSGRIIVQKETEPDGHQQAFDFTASYDQDGFILSDGQSNDSGLLLAGTYSVSETLPDGWEQTDVTCTSNLRQNQGVIAPENIALNPGETVTCIFTNTYVEPELLITKTNDSFPTVETPGETVEYTLTVQAVGNFVNDVTVTDLPPEGFEYEGGSAEATSSEGNAHDGPLELSHDYASPGIWSLGNMKAGETVTLKYKTKISNSQDDGTYDDMAYAKGTSGVGNQTLATDTNDADNFAGTLVAVATPGTPSTVSIDTDHRTETDTDKEYVLGASTGLPGTGANGKFLALAIFLLAGGLGLLFWDRRRSKMTVLALAVVVSVFGAGQASAATNLAVEIEEPEAVVGSPNFKIGFVALDILGRSLQATCYEATYGAFQTIDLIPGGSSGDCQVNSSVMPSDGDYEFYVEVSTVGEEGDDSVTSDHVNVKLVSTHPGTPHNYERDQATCDDIITFTTADDGDRTVKVELYRSTEKDFTADVPVATVMIGANQNGEFVVTPPDCQEDYWYAIRAVDAYGNGSGFVGDEDVDVDTDTDTDTIFLDGGTSGGGGAIATANAAGVGTEGGQVEGAATGTGGDNGEVLGETDVNEQAVINNALDWMKEHPLFSSLSLLALILLTVYGYRLYRDKYLT